jgi:hypothetical protein
VADAVSAKPPTRAADFPLASSHEPNPIRNGMTNRKANLRVAYAFGHGLSYTSFAYSDLEVVVHDMSDRIALTVHATNANTGLHDGAEVVQIYISDACMQKSASLRQNMLPG